MSRRIHFRPNQTNRNIEYLKEQIEQLTGYMFYNQENNEVTTFTKVGNESFFEIGSEWLYGSTKNSINKRSELIHEYPNGSASYATIETAGDIQSYLDNNQNIINEILNNEMDYWRLNYTKHLIKMYQFAVDNNLDVWLH